MRINEIDHIVFAWILNAVWQIGLLSLVAMLVQPLLKNSSAHFRHYYWVVALFLCVLIPVLSLVLLGLPQPVENQPFFLQALAGPSSTALAPLLEREPIAVPRPLPQFAIWAYLAWLGLALLAFVRSVLTVAAFRKKAQAGQSDPWLDDIVRQCAAAFGTHRVRAVASDEVQSPLTIGFRKPVILLPSATLLTRDRLTLIAVIGHEMAHIKRKDFLVNLLTQLIVIPVQFHPLIWHLLGKMRRECELACDEMVTASLLSKRVYAGRLLEVAAKSIKGGTMRPQLAFGTDSLEERIKALLAPSKFTASRWLQRAVTIFACSILLLTGAGTGLVFVRAQDTSAPATQEQRTVSSDETVYELPDKGVVPPKILNQTIPSYTEEALSAGVEGILALECIIRKSGRVADCRVVRSLGYGLDEATMKEIEDNWRLSPATVEGNPVNLKAKIELTFNLRSHADAISLSEAEGMRVDGIRLVGFEEDEAASARALLKMRESTTFQKSALESDAKTLQEKFQSVTWTLLKGGSGGVVVKYRLTARR